MKLEKFDAASKIKVLDEAKAFTGLGSKEVEELGEKSLVIMKQGAGRRNSRETESNWWWNSVME